MRMMPPATHRNDWRRTMVLFALTGLVESLAFGHLGAFTPLYLQQLHVAQSAVPFWTGLLSALGFVIGLPLLPFWGVWADRYGRKLIIIRSAVVEALLFTTAALSVNVWMLAAARFLSGFVLGNTGVMMAVQSEITPRERLGTTIGIVSAGSPVGMAIGPYLGGLVVKGIGIRSLLLIDAGLTVLVALMLAALLHEEPHPVGGAQSTRAGVIAALRAILHTPRVASLFVTIFLINFGVNASGPYVPIIIQRLYHGTSLAPTIGAVLTISGVAMAIATPWWGPLGDRLGHMRMLRLCAFIIAVTLAGQAMSVTVWQVGAWRAAQGLCQGGLGALLMVLLAVYTPPERRSSILTMSLLPAQLAWFFGPLAGSGLSSAGLLVPFWVGAGTVLAGFVASFRVGREGGLRPA